jgi:hypothetical protein
MFRAQVIKYCTERDVVSLIESVSLFVAMEYWYLYAGSKRDALKLKY